jgi:hypothetical protein
MVQVGINPMAQLNVASEWFWRIMGNHLFNVTVYGVIPFVYWFWDSRVIWLMCAKADGCLFELVDIADDAFGTSEMTESRFYSEG